MCVYVCARVCVPVYIHLITWGPHHPELPHHLLVIPRNTRCRQIKPVPTLFSTLIAPRGPQSNLSDNFVMGSPPHPWRPDSDEGQYFASRQPLSHSSVTHAHHVRTCVCLSLRPSLTPPPPPSPPPCPAVRGDRKHSSNMSLDLALEGYPAPGYYTMCVYYTKIRTCLLPARPQ